MTTTNTEELRELLRLAAKAACVFLTPEAMADVFPGFEWDEVDEPVFTGNAMVGTIAWTGEDGKPAGTKRLRWTPHLDDGQSRRLQVALEIELHVFNGKSHAGRRDVFWCTENWFPDGDANAAARMATLRAAAEIGRAARSA